MIKVASYCRVSTDKDEQLDSLEHQKEFFTEFAVKNGHKLVRLYADEGISGTQALKRENFMRMIRDCEDGKIDLIQAESINDMIRASSELEAKLAVNSLVGNTSKLVEKIEEDFLDLLSNIEVNIDYPEYDD